MATIKQSVGSAKSVNQTITGGASGLSQTLDKIGYSSSITENPTVVDQSLNNGGVTSDNVSRVQWGSITGNIDNQTDLINLLNKQKEGLEDQIKEAKQESEQNLQNTKEELEQTLIDAQESLANSIVEVDKKFSGYVKPEEIPTKLSELINDVGYLTKHQSLQGYIKEGDLSEAISKEDQLVKNFVRDNYQPKGEYLTQHQNLSDYAKKDDLKPLATKDDIPTKVSELENDSNYVDSSYVQELVSSFEACKVISIGTTEYMKLKPKDMGTVYIVFNSQGTIYRVYIGTVLIYSENVLDNQGFPYTFPIIL